MSESSGLIAGTLVSAREWVCDSVWPKLWPILRTTLRVVTSIVCAQMLMDALMSIAMLRVAEAVGYGLIALVALMLLRPYVGCMASYLFFLTFAYHIFNPLNLGHLDDQSFYPDRHSPENADRLLYLVWLPTLAVLAVFIVRKLFGEGTQQKENVQKVVSKVIPRSRVAANVPPAELLVRPSQGEESGTTLLRPQPASQTDPQLLLKPSHADGREE